MADKKGGALRRKLSSAERFNDLAIFLGYFQVNTSASKSKALLFLVTLFDQYFGLGALLVLALLIP